MYLKSSTFFSVRFTLTVNMIVIEEDSPECKTTHAQPQLQGATQEMSEISQLIPPPAYSPAPYRPIYHSISTPSRNPPIYPHEPPKTPRRRIIKRVLIIIAFCVLCALLENYLDFGLDPFMRHVRSLLLYHNNKILTKVSEERKGRRQRRKGPK